MSSRASIDRRSPRLARFSAWSVVLAGLAGAAACGGIGITSSDEASNAPADAATLFEGTGSAASGDAASLDGGVTTSGEAGAAVSPADSADLASLCGNTSACSPDEAAANGCGESGGVDVDGGASGSPGSPGIDDAGARGSACRVTVTSAGGSSGSGGVKTAAICTIAGTGVDGTACTSGSDCASGFECIGTPGVCRRYCCSGTCTAGSSFCDVQPVAGQSSASGQDVALTVPACVPIDTCKLLMTNGCPSGNTCGVVADDGTTSCVAVGSAGEGDSCDAVHCQDNFVCLGQKGSRRCEKLCHVGGSDCSGSQICTGNAQIFTDSTIGVCQ